MKKNELYIIVELDPAQESVLRALAQINGRTMEEEAEKKLRDILDAALAQFREAVRMQQ